MNNEKIKVSINPAFVNKTPPHDTRYFAEGFDSVECSVDQFINYVCNYGYAFSYVFNDSYRNAKNFKEAHIVAVDVDGDRPLEDALNDRLVKNSSLFVYTTPSHTKEINRYRIVFKLPYPLTCKKDLTSLKRSLCTRLSGDRSATDPARLFYGCNKSEPMVFNNQISEKLLSELINEDRVKTFKNDIERYRATSHQSPIRFDEDEELTTATDEIIAIKDVVRNTPIYCPRHYDTNPSAFANKTDKGTYVHCRACQKTWWMKGAKQKYDFNSLEKLLIETSTRQIESNKDPELDYADANLSPFFDDDGEDVKQMLSASAVKVVEEQYLQLSYLPARINYVKSGKGTGKTTSLAKMLGYSKLNNARTLLIGHRQALIGATCEKLGLECYLDDKKFKSNQDRYGICFDSLTRIKYTEYDLIIIDEVEQVIAHLMSETMERNRAKAFRQLLDLIWRSKQVVVLDADISWLSFAFFNIIVKNAEKMISGLKPKHKKEFTTHFYINTYKKKSPKVGLYNTEEQLTDHFINSVEDGKRIFVACNSKNQVQKLTELAKEYIDDSQVLSITSENSRVDEIQSFIKNIDTEILNYQVVLASPSLGTGIDITFDNNEELIDCVYGFFRPLINTHFDIDQQLARVRHPKSVHVWVSKEFYTFETDLGVIVDDYMVDNAVEVFHQQFLIQTPKLNLIDPLTATAALVLAKERSSKNEMRSNFIKYKLEQNIDIEQVDHDSDAFINGKDFLELARGLNIDKKVTEIESATVLNKLEHLLIKRKLDSNHDYVSRDERISFIKTNIELFYRKPAIYSLIFDEVKSQQSKKIRAYELLVDENACPNTRMYSPLTKEDRQRLKIFSHELTAAKILRGMLETTPLLNNAVFDCEKEYTSTDLAEFAKTCLSHKPYIETHLKMPVRKDVKDKPIQQFHKMLRELGIERINSRTMTNPDKTKTYFYKLCKESIDNIQSIVEHRKSVEPKAWQFIDRLHGFTYTNDQLKKISDLTDSY